MTLDASALERMVRARVLIVEDEGIVAKDLHNSLRSLGYTVVGTSPTGSDAVTKAQALRPDLILMDIRLRGDMDGIAAAGIIREGLDVPIVFLTAYADADTLERAAKIGPYGYVLKPFDERELHVTLMMAMCKHRAFAELDRRVHERTDELARTEAKYRRLESIAELGLFALGSPDTDAVMQRAVRLVAESLDVELAKVLELQPDGASLVVRAGVGWSDGVVGRSVVSAGRDSQAGYTIAASEPVVVSNFRTETRFGLSPLLSEHGAATGMSVLIHAPGHEGRLYGVLGAHAKTLRHFTGQDVNFLQAVANVVATAIMRSVAESKIRQTERIVEEERVRAGVAEEAVRARDEFLSVASHELRTPVAALQLQLAALRELLAPHVASLEPIIAQTAGGATRTIARLASLVEGVLDVSRISLGRLELQTETFDLAETVREVVARHGDAAGRAGCELRTEAAQAVRGTWDRARIEQVISNLLSNALKFGAGRQVDIILQRVDGEARLSFRDRGEGFDPADAQRILRRFERAVSPRNYGGLGLGLYLTGEIVREHGGRVDVAARPGDGATFTVVLPCECEKER